MTIIYPRWHMFEEKREAVMAIAAGALPKLLWERIRPDFDRLIEAVSYCRADQ